MSERQGRRVDAGPIADCTAPFFVGARSSNRDGRRSFMWGEDIDPAENRRAQGVRTSRVAGKFPHRIHTIR